MIDIDINLVRRMLMHLLHTTGSELPITMRGLHDAVITKSLINANHQYTEEWVHKMFKFAFEHLQETGLMQQVVADLNAPGITLTTDGIELASVIQVDTFWKETEWAFRDSGLPLTLGTLRSFIATRVSDCAQGRI